MTRVLAVLVGVVVCAGPAMAADSYTCVDSSASVNDWSWCAASACGTPVATVADALAAVGAAGLGPSAEHLICVGTPGIHTESVVLDGVDGSLGAVELFFAEGSGTNWCPSGGDAGFDASGAAGSPFSLSLFGLRTAQADCSPAPGPLVSLENVNFSMSAASVVGTTTAVLSGSGAGSWAVYNSLWTGLGATAAIGAADLSINSSEISGASITGSPLLTGVVLSFVDAAIHGNVVVGAPLVSAERLVFNEGLVSENAVIGGDDLFALVRNTSAELQVARLHESEFSGNVLLASGGTATPIASPVPYVSPQPGLLACDPTASQGLGFETRGPISWSGTAADAALLSVGTSGAAPLEVTVQRNLFGPQQLGLGGALVRMDSVGSGSRARFFHNSVDQQTGFVLEVPAPTGSLAFYSARNLLLGSARLSLGTSVNWVEVTMDQLEDPESSWALVSAGLPGIAGPFPRPLDWGDPANRLAGADVLAVDDCSRILLMCPEISSCAGIFMEPICPLTSAGAGLIPTASASVSAGLPWPWMGDPWGAGAGSMVGPTGWLCGAYEVVYEDSDADGYSSLVDCDDASALTLPVLPANDGYSVSDCGPIGDCYVCPPGSIPVGDDDDSSGDDDDSSGDDDDSTVGEEATEQDEAPAACSSPGCGTTLSLGLLPLLPLGARRRRRD